MTSVRRALAVSFAERYLTILLALGSNMLLARLLTPSEIGLYSVSLAVIGVAQVLREFGLGNYLIQEKELTDDHLRTVFGLSLLLGTILFAAVAAAAPLAARFYAEPKMQMTIWIAALNFLILPFCTVRLALLRRSMRFKALLYVSITATLVSQLITVALALAGFGSNSMAIGSVALNLSMALGTYVAHIDRRILGPNLKMWRPMLRFGGQSTVANIVTSVSMDANDLVVGKVLGFGPVALLSKAQGLVNLVHRDVMGAVRNVALPAFAQAHRSNEALAEQLIKAVSIVTVLAWAFYGWLTLFSLEATRLLFGTQWDESAVLVPYFAAGCALGAITSLMPSALIAIGRIETLTKLELFLQPLRFVLVVIAAVVFTSMEAVALAFLASAAISTPVFVAFTRRAMGINTRILNRALLRSLAVALSAVTPSGLFALWAGLGRQAPLDLVLVGLSAALGVPFALLAAHLMNHPIVNEPAYLKVASWIRARTIQGNLDSKKSTARQQRDSKL